MEAKIKMAACVFRPVPCAVSANRVWNEERLQLASTSHGVKGNLARSGLLNRNKMVRLSILCAVCVASLVSTVSAAATEEQEPTEDYEEEFVVPFHGQKFDVFDWQLCTAVADANPGNVLISPISVKFLLNMLYEGSSGETAKELEKILQLPENKSVARMKTSAVLRSLQALDPNYVMEIGTKIFVDHSLTPKNWFQRILFLYYNAYIEKLNFTDYKTSVDKINYWVESVTHGHIKELITQGNLNQAVMLLVNAVYFKGTWKSFFRPEEGFTGSFETPDGPQMVEYMKQTNYFYYSKSPEINAQILRLPYKGQKFAMYIILPEKKGGLKELIKTIDPFVLRKHIWQMEETSTEVILPKFKFQYKSDLKEVLRKLGLNKIFDSYGEMKGLIQNKKTKNFVVSHVIQKAGIEVNEEGSIAAAATEMQLINKIGVQDELFNASHPFLFFIEDETTGTVVFVGKFMGPDTEIKEIKMTPTPAPPPTTTAASATTTTPTSTTKTTTPTPPPQRKTQEKTESTPRKPNPSQATPTRPSPPKLFELKQKKLKAELRQSSFTLAGNQAYLR